MKFIKTGGAAALVTISAALVAAGCGSGSSGGASDAVTSSKALDFVPKTAVGYITVDTDFKGDNWKQFDDLAQGLYPKFTSVGGQIDKALKDDDSKVDYDTDIDPWLGDTAGLAVLTVTKNGDDATFVAWAEVTDRAKLEKFAKDQGLKKGDKVGDFTEWTKDDETIAVSDDLVFLAEDKASLEKTLKYDGDSITDADGIDDVAGEVGDDTLAAVVVSGDGVRKAIDENSSAKALKDLDVVKDFDGASIGVTAEDKGLRVHAYTHADGAGKDIKNTDNDILQALPGNTLLAIGAQDLGGQLKAGVESLGSDNAQLQQQLGAVTGALGVDLDDLATAFSGEFALGVSADDEGLQGIVSGVAGAAMGGGSSSLNPAALTQAGAVTLAFENKETTTATLDKLVGAIGGLAGGASPKTGTAGDFETKSLSLGGLPITAASSDDVAAVSIGTDVFTNWGTDSLGDNDAFKDAWSAADAPSDVAASFWLDWPRVAKLASLDSSDKATAGGWVGWAESDTDSGTFDLFMHIETK
ncbi:MAG: hypothetical protein JWN72_2562 [Thermoleophilia bacterium]|nr:hypothetical protein [Thermoleophilia bacterium]